MADDRRDKRRSDSVLDFYWDPLEPAADKTYSTTIRIKVSGWWDGGRPMEVAVSVYQRGEEPPTGNSVAIQNGVAMCPLTGLVPSHHYLVVVWIGDKQVQKLIAVPELPKPKKPEQEALELERVQLERAKLASELKKIEPSKPNRKIELLGIVRLGNEFVGINICRLGKNGKPELGEVSAFDGLFRTWTVKPDENEIIAVFKLHERPRKITFFLPDDREVKVSVEVPAKPTGPKADVKRVEVSSAGQRIKKSFQRGLRGGE